ncbi:MAG: TrmH family RNA methyltransferase [Nocardioides sp.]
MAADSTLAPLARSSARVRSARALTRRKERARQRRFIADGPHAVGAALARNDLVIEVFGTRAARDAYPELVGAAGRRWTTVTADALASISEAVSPAGVVAVCRFFDVPLQIADASTLITICCEVRDPGNVGTVIRTSDAAGVQAVILTEKSVDPYNPKAVRATVGSLFNVPLTIGVGVAESVAACRDAGLQILAADGAGDVDLTRSDAILSAPTAWLFGNEAWGLPEETASLADRRVRIPIFGRAESLNLSTAAAVCLYASARAQRRVALS